MTVPVSGLTDLSDSQATPAADLNANERQRVGKFGRIISRTTAAQPGSPSDGDAYLVPTGATGSGWSVNVGKIAIYYSGIWNYFTPAESWRGWVNDEDLFIRYDGSTWDIISALPRTPAVAQSSSSLSITASHRGRLIVCDTSSNSITLNLLAAASAGSGFMFGIKKKSASNTLTVDPNSTEVIDDASTIALTEDEDSRWIVCDGSEWHTVGGGGGGGGASLPFTDAVPHFERASDGTSTGQFNLDNVAPATNVEVQWPAIPGQMALLSDVTGGGNGDAAFGENSGGHSGLNYAYYAGGVRAGNSLLIASGSTIALTDNATNYIELYIAAGAIVVAKNTTGFTPARFAMAEAVTLAGAITSVTDRRYWINVPSINAGVCDGRLTLESGVAVSASDQTAKTTIYFTPYNGNIIALYNGSSWTPIPFSETSLALGTLTADKNYDVFAYISSGVLALELSAAWTNDTTRADALTTQDGVLVKSGSTTRRYIGTFRTKTTTTTEDSSVNRCVWPMYHRVPRLLLIRDSTDSWTYSTGSFRQANGSSANQVNIVTGWTDTHLSLGVFSRASNSTTTARTVASGIGIGSSTTNSAQLIQPANCTSVISALPAARLVHTAALGYSSYLWLEMGGGADTQTWFGDVGSTNFQSGMMGSVEC